MLDVRLIRSDPEMVKAGIARRGEDTAPVDEIHALDADLRALAAKRDSLRAEIRVISNEVGTLFREQRKDEATELQAQSRLLGAEEKDLDSQYEQLEVQLRDRLLRVPNLPADDCPDGLTEADNVVLRVEQHDPDAYQEHQRVPHWETGEQLGILDVERAVKMSGSMFVMYRGMGATLVRALCQLAIDRNVDLYEEVRPPTLVKTDTMIATGHLPKFTEEAYQIEHDDLWAIPTAEVPLTSLLRDEIVPDAELPKRFVAHTSCFRREAGSAGKDTRGLLRVHEFDKVEILSYCSPDQAAEMHAEILGRAEGLIRDLGLSYRILDLCAGDIGGSAARTFDIEVYAPGVDNWLEVSSVSWFRDYQARRANLRHKPEGGKGTEILHTLNGSALAVPRVWAAIVETYRQPDGTVWIPELLQPYMPRRHEHRLMAGGPVTELAQVIPGRGDPPVDIGTGHAMREVTEVVAADPAAWTPEMAARVGGFFDERAPSWSSLDGRTEILEPLRDALERGGPIVGPVVELGPGVGAGTSILADRFAHIVAGDLSGEMLRRLSPDLADRIQLDGSSLPIRSGSVGAVVCVNMLLFADEVRRVLSDDGVLVWVNSIGECTPIHLSAELVAGALGEGFEVTASRAGWGTWAVARRA